MSSPKVFVSHSHKDDAFTARLVADLRAAGADVWVDTTEIAYDDFIKRINAGLANRDWLILVQTPESLRSQWVQMEVNAAINLMMQGEMRGVIPVLAQPCERKDIPVMWRTLHFYDASSDYAGALAGLRRVLGLDAPPNRMSAPSIAMTAGLPDQDVAQATPPATVGDMPEPVLAHITTLPSHEPSEPAPTPVAAQTLESMIQEAPVTPILAPPARRHVSRPRLVAAGAGVIVIGVIAAFALPPLLDSGHGAGAWQYQSSGVSLWLDAVSCPNVSTCFAAGHTAAAVDPQSRSTIIATTDGGHTWHLQTSSISDALLGIACPSVTTCYALGFNSTLWATTDGGNTWQSSSTIPGMTGLGAVRGMACPGTKTCYVVGDIGVVATTDGGHTWHNQNTNGVGLQDVACPNAATCYAVGDSIVATTDGHTWHEVLSSVGDTARAVSCPSTTVCYAVGWAGLLASTTDGGRHWHNQTINASAYLEGIACPNTQICYAAGDNGEGDSGTIASTTDGGQTWRLQPGLRHFLSGMACPAVTTCYAVGGHGTILART